MAQIISSIPSDQVQNRGERIVFQAMERHLPDHFFGFHSLPFLREHAQGGNLVDGEIDFLLLDLKRGVLLVLEVKEGIIMSKVQGTLQRWFQNGRLMDQSPWEQAKGNKYSLMRWICGKLNWPEKHFPLSHGHAVLLPDVHVEIESPAPGITRDETLIWTTGEELARKLDACSQHWQQKTRLRPSDDTIQRLRKLMIPEFVFGNTLRDRLGAERRSLIEHEAQLGQLLDFIGNRRQVRIAGSAGSGKTMLALAKARQLAAAGQSVLLLAYNKEIAAYLAEHVKPISEITVSGFHDFCMKRCEAAGLAWPQGRANKPEFWWQELPELLERALDRTPAAFDGLLVDEAQDFQFAAWLALQKLIKPNGWYYIFYDSDQNIFKGDMEFPVTDPPFLLTRNCRSTRAIIEAVNARTGMALIPREGLPEGAPVRTESATAPAQRKKLLGKILHDWIRKEGLTENQIVVLGAHNLLHTCLGEDPKAGAFTIVERGAPAPGTVPYYTYMAFKGCESDAIILLDVDPADKRWNKQGLYTAMTRARHMLALIET
jgi:hypothetical protein